MCSTFWEVMPSPTHGPQAATTYDAQSTFVFTYTFQDGAEVLIWMGDRWNDKGRGSVGQASYVSLGWAALACLYAICMHQRSRHSMHGRRMGTT